MSRCFPFPPPGYEKKCRTDETDLLTKEKLKEKKSKKDKKDKEKREDKEKKDKDKSKEKRKDKKDRKEKHKDKDRDNDKEKKLISEEKRVDDQSAFYNGEKFGQQKEIKDSKYVQELARRIRDDDKASSSYMVQKILTSDQKRDAQQGMAVENRIGIQSKNKEKVGIQSKNKEKVKNHNDDNGMVNVQRNHINARGLEKAVGQNVSGRDQGKVEGITKQVDKRDSEKQRNHINAKGLEKVFGQNFSGSDQDTVEGITKPMEKKDAEKQMEEKENSKHKESNIIGEKRKDRDREKKHKSKCKDLDKEKKKEEKAKGMSEPSKDKPPNLKGGANLKENSQDPLDFRNLKPSTPLKLGSMNSTGVKNVAKHKELESGQDSQAWQSVEVVDCLKSSSKSSGNEGSLGKRKELEINGFLHDNGSRPNKFQRPLSPSHLAIENGRKLEMCQTAVQVERQEPPNSRSVNTKEQKINGLIAAPQSNICLARPSASNVAANENGEASVKSPHPDIKYLRWILSVPKLEEVPNSDDQDWLFSSKQLHSKKRNEGSLGADEEQQVWEEALHIESADISALPYVIPY